MKKLLLSVLAVQMLALLAVSPTSAQFDELGLVVRPAIVEITGNPGETSKVEITIESNSSKPIGVTIGSRSVLPNDPEIDQANRKLFDASSWILPVQKDLLLEPNEQFTTEIQIIVPEDASPGGHYALISYTPIALEQVNDSGTRVQAQPEISSLLLITTPGDITESGEAEVISPDLINFNKGINSGVKFSNTGNIHIIPNLKANIIRSNGSLVESITLQPQLSLPNTIKEFIIDWQPDGEWGKFRIDYTFEFGTPKQTIRVMTDDFYVLPSSGTIIFMISVSVVAFLIALFVWKWFRRAVLKKGRYLRRGKKYKSKKTDLKNIDSRQMDIITRSPGLKDRSQTQRPHPPAKRTKIKVKKFD